MWVFVLLFTVLIENILLMWRRHHWRWRDAKLQFQNFQHFERGGIFIVPHLLWHGASAFAVSSKGSIRHSSTDSVTYIRTRIYRRTRFASSCHILWCGRLVYRQEKLTLDNIDLKNRKCLMCVLINAQSLSLCCFLNTCNSLKLHCYEF